MNNCPFHPQQLIKSIYKIDGFDEIRNTYQTEGKYFITEVMLEGMEDIKEEYSDWPEGEGFGSSDFTFALKSFIDFVIDNGGLSEKFKTGFTPYLSITKK
jgi:hypothetical protein